MDYDVRQLIRDQQVKFVLFFLPMSAILLLAYCGYELLLEPHLFGAFLSLRIGYMFLAAGLWYLLFNFKGVRKYVVFVAYLAYLALVLIQWIMLYFVDYFLAYLLGFLAVYLAVSVLMPFHPLFLTSMFPFVSIVFLILLPSLDLESYDLINAVFNTVTTWTITAIFAYIRYSYLLNQSELIIKRDRNLEELRKSQALLVKYESMAALGGIVAGVAHEMNTPIYTINLNAQALKSEFLYLIDDLKLGKLDVKDYECSILEQVKMIDNNCRRLDDIQQSFKRVSYNQSAQKNTHYNLRTTVEDSLKTMSYKTREAHLDIRVTGGDDILCYGRAGLITHIITNLIDNIITHAYGAIGGVVDIRVSSDVLGHTLCVQD